MDAPASKNNDNWRAVRMWELWKYWTKITWKTAVIRNPRRRSTDLQIVERKHKNQPAEKIRNKKQRKQKSTRRKIEIENKERPNENQPAENI